MFIYVSAYNTGSQWHLWTRSLYENGAVFFRVAMYTRVHARETIAKRVAYRNLDASCVLARIANLGSGGEGAGSGGRSRQGAEAVSGA